MHLESDGRALVELGRGLRASGYRFVTPTPATHRRVNARPGNDRTTTLRGALGWSRAFAPGTLGEPFEAALAAAGALVPAGPLLRSTLRFSSLDDAIYAHSAHPTRAVDAVFFGPDTYRFVALCQRVVRPSGRLVDVGTGTGAGGLSLVDRAGTVVLADISPAALRLARVNAAIAGAADVEVVESDVLAGVSGPIDTVVANPPYLVDRERRRYRDGGGELGGELSLRIVREALDRLAPGGQLVLYTGSPVIDGEHPLRAALGPILATRACRHTWEELDPDVFGEELDAPAYSGVERLAVVALVVEVA
jgi:release factor glutamine methyltransferase